MSYVQKQGKDKAWKKSVLRNLATDIVLLGKIKTTEYKAKELKKVVDRLITFGKKGSVADRRHVASYLRNEKDENGILATKKLFDEIALKYKDRQGGYTRITRIGYRRGDNALMCLIELV